ncbi:hypothetical protein J1N35_038767 [Gossypium stocksii]|uniref:Uncharacterized protein n=1 Tax=Gossypium stocksii TaxID=47602 RepID=A0A9D3UMG6_9ROSI|nr:hypothetical protein J1N35_038767 [Gossypium stocksii]
MGALQKAVAKLHEDVSQWSAKLNNGLNELKMEFKGELKLQLKDLKDGLQREIKSKMLSLLELYLGRPSTSVTDGQSSVPIPAG